MKHSSRHQSKPLSPNEKLSLSVSRHLHGYDISALDVRFREKFMALDRRLLAPTFLGSLFCSLSVLVRPVALMTLALLAVMGTSRFATISLTGFGESTEAVEIAETIELEAELAANLSQAMAVAIPDTLQQRKQVSFIAGLIAMHRPTIPDCGAIAKEIVRLSAEEQVDPFYVTAIIATESRFSTTAKSRVGALGLMQLMPATAHEVSRRKTGKKSYPLLTDANINIGLGISYIKQLEGHYRGNRFNALTAYNWGLTNVDKALKGRLTVPRSVRQYANTILGNTLRWRKHYQNAEMSAAELSKEIEDAAKVAAKTKST